MDELIAIGIGLVLVTLNAVQIIWVIKSRRFGQKWRKPFWLAFTATVLLYAASTSLILIEAALKW